jgi:hypothetical protein
MNFSKILLVLSVVSNLTAYVIYFRLILKNKIKPHAITYLVWTIILGLNFIIQISSGVGVGSILLGTNFAGCLIIFLLCYIKNYIVYDKIDWLCFALAIFTVILWLITKTPIYSVILSCVIDLLALLPSFRKSYRKPWEDSALVYFISGSEYLLSFPSYGVISFIVLLYPVCVVTFDFAYSIMIIIRRLQLKRQSKY